MSLGGRENLEAASRDLIAASRAAPDDPAPRIALAELNFLAYGEADGFPSGDVEMRKVLKEFGDVEDALVSLYEIRSSNFQKDPSLSEEFLTRALAQNPRCAKVFIHRGISLIKDRRFEEGAEILDQALKVNPRDPTALAHRAAAAWLAHDDDLCAQMQKRLYELDAKTPLFARSLGEHLVSLYRFLDAIPYFEKALELDPHNVPAMHGLAKALIYCGRGEQARAVLERAKKAEAGLVNAWRTNALTLEDLLAKEYETVDSGGFEFRMHKDDLEVLKGYLLPIADEALAFLGTKYGYKPEGKVRVEVFHEWVDFSVRTIGYRNFTALGACFGRFITMASPVDQELRRQDFMWTATIWHEYAHVLTLGLSKHRVPRWLTEGISVHEERAKNPAWERGMDRELLDAWHNHDIYPLRLLNQAFRGPRILFGYFQGGLVVDYLAQQHGFAKVVDMLRLYAEDLPAEQIFKNAFGYSTSEFDKRFLAWIWETRLKDLRITPHLDDRAVERARIQIAAEPRDLETRVALGFAMVHRGALIDAGQYLAAVLRADPKHPGGLLLQAELIRRKGTVDEIKDAYAKAFAAGAEDFDARMAFGDVLVKAGEVDAALRQYQLSKRCWGSCTDQASSPHLRIARVLRKAGRDDEALMELKSFCKQTGRAFAPRLEIAEFEKQRGDRASEMRYLEEANAIDPFMRSLHERLAESYSALGKKDLAIRELKVALAVRPELDRKYLDKKPDEQIPPFDSPEEKEARALICVRLARLCKEALRDGEIASWLERAEKEAKGTDAESEVASAKREITGK
jgi:tetratricopeptide (TPR) repeat protein